MLAFVKKSWLFLVLFIVIATMTVALMEIRKEYRHTQAEFQKLQASFHEGIQTAALKSAVVQNTDSDSKTKNAYQQWMHAKKLVDHFYKKSDGRFKKQWGLFLVVQARKHDIDPKIVFQLLKLESGGTFDPHMVGPKTKYGRAYGMAQFMGNTAPWIAKMADMPYQKKKLFDPYYSIELAVTYLDFLHDRYGNWNEALTAYNRGIYGLKTYIRKHGDSKSQYAVTIRQRAEKANVSYVPGG